MTSEVIYLGGLRTECTHLRSGNKIYTDAPVDNHGKGENFSPTDLVATGLGSCMIAIMGIAGMTHDIDIVGTKATINKIMGTDPRRITRIEVDLYMPDNKYTSKEKKILENAALTCPVMKSLHPDLEEVVNFHWH